MYYKVNYKIHCVASNTQKAVSRLLCLFNKLPERTPLPAFISYHTHIKVSKHKHTVQCQPILNFSNTTVLEWW